MHAWNLKYFYSTKGIKLAKCNLTSWEDTTHQMKMLICFSALWKLFFNMYVWHVMYLAMMKDYLFSVLCEATSFICQTFYRTCVCSVPTAFWPTTMIKMLIFSRAESRKTSWAQRVVTLRILLIKGFLPPQTELTNNPPFKMPSSLGKTKDAQWSNFF